MSIGAHDVSRRWRFVGQAKPVNVQPYVALKTGGVTVNFACEVRRHQTVRVRHPGRLKCAPGRVGEHLPDQFF
jgi:hypothetical protein